MKILRYLFSTLFTFLLSVTLLGYIGLNMAKTITNEKVIDKMIDRANINELIVNEDGTYTEFGNELKEHMVNAGVPEELVVEFATAEPIEEFVTDYIDSTFDYVFEGKDYKHITATDIENLINNNIDSIVSEIREKNLEGADQLTDERVESIKTKVSDLSHEIGDKIPNLENEFEDEQYKIAIHVMRLLLSGSFKAVLLSIIIFSILMLVLLNLKDCNFGYWIGIPMILVGLPFAFSGFILNGVKFTSNVKILETLYEEIVANILQMGMITLLVGLAFLILACVFYTIKNKKRKNALNTDNNFSNEINELDKREEEIKQETNELIEKIEEVKNVANTIKEKYCAYCGGKLPEDQKYCNNCGAEQK